MRKDVKPELPTDQRKPQTRRDLQRTANKRLREQTRRILGKHYASKYPR